VKSFNFSFGKSRFFCFLLSTLTRLFPNEGRSSKLKGISRAWCRKPVESAVAVKAEEAVVVEHHAQHSSPLLHDLECLVDGAEHPLHLAQQELVHPLVARRERKGPPTAS
jgi:hypothetical protein